jgi:hypothetical protein
MKSPPHQIHDDIAFNRSRPSSAVRTTRRSLAPRLPCRRPSSGWPGRRPRCHRRQVTDGERRLEAPNRRGGASPGSWSGRRRRAAAPHHVAARTLPAAPTSASARPMGPGSYLLWPKRDWSNRTGHVLGLPPDDRRVRRPALRAYREYGRYLVDDARSVLPSTRVAARRAARPGQIAHPRWVARRRPIVTAAHVGNNDLVGASHRGLACCSTSSPTIRVPELFDTSGRNASSGTPRSSRGATCGRSRRASDGANCSASSTATAATSR